MHQLVVLAGEQLGAAVPQTGVQTELVAARGRARPMVGAPTRRPLPSRCPGRTPAVHCSETPSPRCLGTAAAPKCFSSSPAARTRWMKSAAWRPARPPDGCTERSGGNTKWMPHEPEASQSTAICPPPTSASAAARRGPGRHARRRSRVRAAAAAGSRRLEAPAQPRCTAAAEAFNRIDADRPELVKTAEVVSDVFDPNVFRVALTVIAVVYRDVTANGTTRRGSSSRSSAAAALGFRP